jgi:hypothetical protein
MQVAPYVATISQAHQEVVAPIPGRSFAEWRNGLIGSDELSQRVHRYETGPARELYKRYNDGPPDMTVAYAIVTGILQLDEVSPELLEAIERPLGFYQMLKERGELREPDDF